MGGVEVGWRWLGGGVEMGQEAGWEGLVEEEEGKEKDGKASVGKKHCW